jgi:hypothetical protein
LVLPLRRLKLENYEVPEFSLKPYGVQGIRLIYDHLKSREREIQSQDLAELLGYKAPNSGGFYRRIYSLLAYGLLEGRAGKFKVTELGENISIPRDKNHENELIKKAVFNVQLWKELYDLHQKELPSSITYDIKDITKVSSAQAQAVEKEVRERYLEDISQIPERLLDLPPPEQNSYSSVDGNKERKMAQEPTIGQENSGKLLFNLAGQIMAVEFKDEDGIEACLDMLKRFGKKIGYYFEYKKLESVELQQEDESA